MFSHNRANVLELKTTHMFRSVHQVAPPELKLLSTIAGLLVFLLLRYDTVLKLTACK